MERHICSGDMKKHICNSGQTDVHHNLLEHVPWKQFVDDMPTT